MKYIGLVLVMCLMFGCVQYTRVGDEQIKEAKQTTTTTTKNGEKKYFQYRHPLSSTIGLQIVAANENGCKSILANMKEHDKPHSYCTDNSASELLPYRMTVRNKPYNFILDLETKTMSECSVLSKEML